MKKILLLFFLKINQLFPQKQHPFNQSTNGVFDLNYTLFEYEHTPELLQQYSSLIDLDILKNKKILDIGCGGWWKALYIAEKYGSEVQGIDLNLNFLKQAQQHIQEKNLADKVYIREENALDMSFEQETFDVIIMSDVLEHIPETEKLFSEVYRVLKKEGVVLFDFAPYYHYFWHHIWDTLCIPWLHIFTTESFRIALYKESVKQKPDQKKRIDLRIGTTKAGKESFVYLNNISRKSFEKIIEKERLRYTSARIDYSMLKNLNFLSKVPLIREIGIRHITGFLKK